MESDAFNNGEEHCFTYVLDYIKKLFSMTALISKKIKEPVKICSLTFRSASNENHWNLSLSSFRH